MTHRLTLLGAALALATTAVARDYNTQWKARGKVSLSINGTGWVPYGQYDAEFPRANPVTSFDASPMGQAAFGERKNGGSEWYTWATQKYTLSSPNTSTSLVRETAAKGRRYCRFLVTFQLNANQPMPTQSLRILIRRYIKHTSSLKLSGIGTNSNNSLSGAKMMTENVAYFDGLGGSGTNETARGYEVQRARFNPEYATFTTNKSWSKKTGYVLSQYRYINGGPYSDVQEYSISPNSFIAVGSPDAQGRQKYVAEVIDYALVKLQNSTRFISAKGKIELDTRIETKVRVSVK